MIQTTPNTIAFSIYRYNGNDKPYMQDYVLEVPENTDMMLLQALIKLQEQDPTLVFRRSCGEGVCGSDGMNINGTNGLACVTRLSALKKPIVVRPLPGFPIIRDLIVDMTQFYKQYEKVKPYLMPAEPVPAKEYLQSPEERKKLDGLYECILCACCSSACPSYWWNPDKFVGPAGLLAAERFLVDSRDTATKDRLKDLEDPYSAFRCRTIMNCAVVCPKGLNPAKAIHDVRKKLVEESS